MGPQQGEASASAGALVRKTISPRREIGMSDRHDE
jgi:hypothetical protein